MILENSKLIAVDFDGTIVEDKYPDIGRPQLFAFETLKKLQQDGHRLVLWTYRHGDKLQKAVEFCRENGIEFYAVNSSFPEEQYKVKDGSRKIHADLFIDDRNFGGMPGWGEIYQQIAGEAPPEPRKKSKKRKKGLFKL